MRKVLSFLLAFGGGLAILLLLREPRPDRRPAEQGAGAPVDAGKFTEVPLDADEQEGPFQVQLRGALSASVAEEEPDPATGRSPLSYKVTTEDTLPRPDTTYGRTKLEAEGFVTGAHRNGAPVGVEVALKNPVPLAEREKLLIGDGVPPVGLWAEYAEQAILAFNAD